MGGLWDAYLRAKGMQICGPFGKILKTYEFSRLLLNIMNFSGMIHENLMQ